MLTVGVHRSCVYRARNIDERVFNRIEQCRRIATRFDSLAVNCLAYVQLASEFSLCAMRPGPRVMKVSETVRFVRAISQPRLPLWSVRDSSHR
ncbi:hypothetical protein WN72_19875 [Bradyrhizobium arachidis]|uniref:Transposase n=1 Tax=Bradyrhizobium arachidis TaxID=858423 RepID=A0AAE7NT84_9BRAD|nr:hypothetical protein WN72_19875 [Bradyrhizobium arachidis]